MNTVTRHLIAAIFVAGIVAQAVEETHAGVRKGRKSAAGATEAPAAGSEAAAVAAPPASVAPAAPSVAPATPIPAPAANIGAIAEFKHELWVPIAALTLHPGQTTTVAVIVRNAGRLIWPAQGSNAIHFSYHWLDAAGNVVVWDGERTKLPYDLRPSDAALLMATVRAPPHAGRFVLRATMVQEGVAWFEERGSQTVDVPAEVLAAN